MRIQGAREFQLLDGGSIHPESRRCRNTQIPSDVSASDLHVLLQSAVFQQGCYMHQNRVPRAASRVKVPHATRLEPKLLECLSHARASDLYARGSVM